MHNLNSTYTPGIQVVGCHTETAFSQHGAKLRRWCPHSNQARRPPSPRAPEELVPEIPSSRHKRSGHLRFVTSINSGCRVVHFLVVMAGRVNMCPLHVIAENT